MSFYAHSNGFWQILSYQLCVVRDVLTPTAYDLRYMQQTLLVCYSHLDKPCYNVRASQGCN